MQQSVADSQQMLNRLASDIFGLFSKNCFNDFNRKLGENAHPFYFELPPHCPASVTLQPAPGDTGKPCGIDYEMKAFVGDSQDDKPHKR